MTKEYYSNGKLLLTAEYVILDGAKGLALPTKFGQSLSLQTSNSENFIWNSLDEDDNIWFSSEFSKNNLKTIYTSDIHASNRLSQILLEAQKLNPSFLPSSTDLNSAEAKLTFPRDWGLGSSSTLIANIAQWADVNPYRLLAATFGGSGYDIACANHNTPILYQRNEFEPTVSEVDFQPNFSDQLFFVYLNQKKNSRDAINSYRNLDFDKPSLVSKINDITYNILKCEDVQEFGLLLNAHEAILSETLKIPTAKESLFSDYKGTIKSLGAWGGDFVLVVGSESEMSYFKNKGYSTILSYKEMIL
ncbi:GYDIA family GHMP kinase [uncultured Maribacter sp.]|uniref:GYDIA family GHMP kinase n=1 Tax=uncultured Maribacter sp. TaxID=431308 RepID=UPI0030ED7BA7|tara:strand:+ start:50637 stop:51548 length:912 start_codon:yes stop_codon:yes gene_type:complete